MSQNALSGTPGGKDSYVIVTLSFRIHETFVNDGSLLLDLDRVHPHNTEKNRNMDKNSTVEKRSVSNSRVNYYPGQIIIIIIITGDK